MTAKNASDATYHARHSDRSLRRAERIAANIESPGHVLDVGCNNGITSRYLLDQGQASQATGIELKASTVDEDLRADDRFTLIEGNIATLDLPSQYDIGVYGAVHHHIMNFNGLSTAVVTLQKLVEHCERQIFFETGQIGEGGRWDWQRAIRRYFRTDEEHFCYLLQSIEQHVRDIAIIGKFWIHGIRRSYIRIDLKPFAERRDVAVPGPVIPSGSVLEGPLYRSFGSGDQALSASADAGESPTAFWVAGRDEDEAHFIKQYRHHPAAAPVEWRIGTAIVGNWAVKPIGRGPMPASLVFPYLDGAASLASLADAPVTTRRDIASQLLAIFSAAANTWLTPIARVLLGTDRDRSLDELCDLNPNNVLIADVDGKPTVRVIDFEQQGTHYRYRNRMHLAAMLLTLRQRRLRATWLWCAGAATGLLWLVRAQFWRFDARVRRRQPSLSSLLVAETRSLSGRILKALLSVAGLK